MPYAITATGWRAINPDMELQDGETFAEEIPQWLINASAAADALREASRIEEEWRATEILEINDQLMALEEGAEALPGTREQWLAYRTRVRNWKEGAEGFPEPANRPWRPAGSTNRNPP
ncbi:hypothetical protein [Pseudomonas sp. S2_A10]|jgi:hypothetical protein